MLYICTYCVFTLWGRNVYLHPPVNVDAGGRLQNDAQYQNYRSAYGIFYFLDVNQLNTFVDLALISAGETDLEIDRVWCFHGAAKGYAPIIFDLRKESGSQELLEACTKVWGALENDPELPLKMVCFAADDVAKFFSS